MHQMKGDEENIVLKEVEVENENGMKSEANKVVDLLLKEIIAIGDDEESIEEITLEEICESNDEKKYTNKCEVCAFETVASRRYIAIQMQGTKKYAKQQSVLYVTFV